MAYLYLDNSKTKNVLSDQETLIRELNSLMNQVDSVRNNLRYKIACRATISARLQDTARQIGLEAQRSAGMRDAFSQIVVLYQQTETKNLNLLQADKLAVLVGANGGAINGKVGDSCGVFSETNAYAFSTGNGTQIMFHEGPPTRPRWEADLDYDNYFPYDPNEKATIQDRLMWAGWGAAPLYSLLKHVPDGLEAYLHYRDGSGSTLIIDYEKAYREDPVIAKNVDIHVANTNNAVKEMIEKGQRPPFSITSEKIPIVQNPSTENWQKTIGRHYIWISADVSAAEDGSITVTTTVHEIDRYNFNKGDEDIATGIKDSANGRFETLGWAKSFDTEGEITFQSVLSDDSTSVQQIPATPDDSRNRRR